MYPPQAGTFSGVPVVVGTTGNTYNPNIGVNSVNNADVLALQADGWSLAVPVYYPTALSTAGINAAMVACNAGGGGVVQLPPLNISLSGTLNLLAGVTLQGSGYGLTGGGSPSLASGTILTGNGTFPLIAANNTDLGSPYGSAASMFAAGVNNCGVRSLGLSNGTYGIKLGALYQMGGLYPRIYDVFVQNCTNWGMWFENCTQGTFELLAFYNNGHGFAFGASGTTLNNFGNSEFRRITGGINSANGSGRVVYFFSRGASALNNVSGFDIGGSGASVSNTQSATMAAPIATTITNTSASITATNAFAAGDPVSFSATTGTTGGQVVAGTTYYVSATGLSSSAFQVSATVGGSVITFNASGSPNVYTGKFGVTDLSQYAIGMPVAFTSTANGFTTTIIYFVNYVSGTSGAGNITVCPYMGGTNGSITQCPTGSTAISIVTKGWPTLEIGGADNGSTITYSSVKGASDEETGGTAHIVFQGITGLDYEAGINHAPSSNCDICVRNVNSQGMRLYTEGTLLLDLDSTAQYMGVYGRQCTLANSNYAGIGITGANSNGVGQLNLRGSSTPDLAANAAFNNQLCWSYAVAELHSQQANGNTLNSSNGNIITYITAATGTLTLPTINTNMAGWKLCISNPTAFTVTISAGVNIVGLGASGTSISLVTLTNTILIAQNNNGTMYWARYV